MRSEEMMKTARSMIERHGLRAQAAAVERASEMQLKGDTAEFARWRQIHDLICELNRTRRQATAEL